MRRDEKGYIVVETVMAFVLYILAILSILTLINVVVVQSRIHYAITEACESVSMYSYILEAAGEAKYLTGRAGKAEKTKTNVNEIVNNLNQIISSARSFDVNEVPKIKENASKIQETASAMKGKDLLVTLVQEIQNAAFSACIAPLTEHYLDNEYDANGKVTQSGKEYLEAFGVEGGLGFSNFVGTYEIGFTDFTISVGLGEDSSTLFDGEGNVVIAVHYDVAYTFGGLQLPFKTLGIRQVVKTKAWLGGEGDGYGG